MGRDIETTEFTREDRTRYREKVKANLAALRELIDAGAFETGRRTIGVEMEVYITDADGNAAPINAKLLERITEGDFQTELAQFNVEFDVKPRRLAGTCFSEIEQGLRRSLNHAHAMAETLDAQVMIVGILPTLTDFDVTEQNLSANPRYKALNDMILAARGEDIFIRIVGDETVAGTGAADLGQDLQELAAASDDQRAQLVATLVAQVNAALDAGDVTASFAIPVREVLNNSTS